MIPTPTNMINYETMPSPKKLNIKSNKAKIIQFQDQ